MNMYLYMHANVHVWWILWLKSDICSNSRGFHWLTSLISEISNSSVKSEAIDQLKWTPMDSLPCMELFIHKDDQLFGLFFVVIHEFTAVVLHLNPMWSFSWWQYVHRGKKKHCTAQTLSVAWWLLKCFLLFFGVMVWLLAPSMVTAKVNQI